MLIKKNYPAVDLRDKKIMQQQCQNIAIFKARRRRVVFGIVGFFITIFIGGKTVPPDQFGWVALVGFTFGIPTVFFMIMYKCPHCGTVPAGVAYSVGRGEASYSKGIHPFPKRCQCCGYYLSKSALNADLQMQKC